jgi:hypothetical protein
MQGCVAPQPSTDTAQPDLQLQGMYLQHSKQCPLHTSLPAAGQLIWEVDLLYQVGIVDTQGGARGAGRCTGVRGGSDGGGAVQCREMRRRRWSQ